MRGWTAPHSRYLPECDVRASPCFTRYLNLNIRTARKLDAHGLEAKVFQDSEAWRLDPLLMSFRQDFNWLNNHENVETRKELMKILMTYAMGTDDDPPDKFQDAVDSPNSYAWSFCRDKWTLAIALSTVNTATSATILHDIAKNVQLVKQGECQHAMDAVDGQRTAYGMAMMVRKHLTPTRHSAGCLRSVRGRELEALKCGTMLSAR